MALLRLRCLAALAVVLTCAAAHAENWPQFRGPSGQGESAEKNLPLNWSATENVAWKVDVPGTGWSSPIVWGDRIFLTSTSEDGVSCHALCFDRNAGKLLWNVEVFKQTPTKKEARNSYATPTPVADGERIYAVFSGGGIAALTFDGKTVWTDQDIKFYGQQGYGPSPALYKDMLVVHVDLTSQGSDPKPGWLKPWDQSYVMALDKLTGKPRWKTMRGLSRVGHTMPRFVEVDGKTQLLSVAGDVVQGFDPDTGEKLWWAANEGETPVPTPVVGDGLAFTAPGFSDHPAIRAFRLGGHGDVTKSNLVWECKKAVPTMASYAFHDHRLYTVKEDGILQCFEATTGKLLWKQRLEGTYAPSPIVADGRIYFLGDDGTTTVIDDGPEFKVLATNPLNEKCQASIAVSNGQFFIRSQQHLLCVGSPGAK
ncbi:MAG: Serine/threonine protein kinase [Phycisphaerales bacterium]|nr:Serine/threonine protein kinase [Phycisphaerales bacterium]